jgi:hypothetical protein
MLHPGKMLRVPGSDLSALFRSRPGHPFLQVVQYHKNRPQSPPPPSHTAAGAWQYNRHTGSTATIAAPLKTACLVKTKHAEPHRYCVLPDRVADKSQSPPGHRRGPFRLRTRGVPPLKPQLPPNNPAMTAPRISRRPVSQQKRGAASDQPEKH